MREARKAQLQTSRFLSQRAPLGALIVATLFAVSVAAEVPRGVFSITTGNKQPLATVLANPNVDGITLRQDWSSLEPTEGNFDFSYLDTAVASCAASNKPVLLRIATQANKPAWVTKAVADAGGSFFTFDDNGTPITIPVFWDPTFLAKKTAMIAALGAHFASNSTVKVVAASFANATSEDWNVPHTGPDVLNWLALGYTTEKLLAAGKLIIDTTMVAFPDQIVTLAVGGSGHVNGTNLDPTSDFAAQSAVTTARATWPGRLNAQKNDLSTFIPVAPGIDSLYEMIWDFRPDVAGQMVFQCVNDPTYRANNGVPQDPALTLRNSVDGAVSYIEKYVEIYQVDVNNLPDTIAYAHTVLTAPSPTPTPSPTPNPSPSPNPFHLDGQVDAVGYLQNSSGLPIYAALRGSTLYLATTSPGNSSQPNDHFLFVTETLLPTASAPPPWAKSGLVAIDSSRPLVAGESTNDYCAWLIAPPSSLALKSAATSGQMEATIDLVETFGQIPATIYVAAAAYLTADGGRLVAQAPLGNGDGNIDPNEFLSLSPIALADENADGIYDRLDPSLSFGINEITRVAGVTTIRWRAVPGQTYQAENTDDLSRPWTLLNAPLTAAPGQLNLATTDSTALPSRFYRVRLVTP